MTIDITVNGMRMIIRDDVIDTDIAELERTGRVARIVDGARIPPPDDPDERHYHLICFRDRRRYDSREIKEVCMGICPFNKRVNGVNDGDPREDCWKVVFEATALDGKSRYVEIEKRV